MEIFKLGKYMGLGIIISPKLSILIYKWKLDADSTDQWIQWVHSV